MLWVICIISDHIKPRGGQAIPRQGIAINHHGNVSSHAETTFQWKLQLFFTFPHMHLLFLTVTLPVPHRG